MAKEQQKEGVPEGTTIKQVHPEPGTIVNLTEKVTAIATDKAPYHKKGEKFEVAPAVFEKMKANGWATEA